MTNKDILDELKKEISLIKRQLPNGEIKILTKAIEALKGDTSEIKKILLDPNKGIVVKVNKNTEEREHKHANDKQRDKIIENFSRTCNEIKKWKDGVNKALWIIFAAISGIIIKLIFGSL
jgi:hypothetical protein